MYKLSFSTFLSWPKKSCPATTQILAGSKYSGMDDEKQNKPVPKDAGKRRIANN